MDIEFMVQDAYAMTRPQWKLANNLEEAGNTFAEAVKANYQLQASGPTAEQEEQDDDSGAEDGDDGDGGDDDELKARERNDASSGEDADVGALPVFLNLPPLTYEQTPGEDDQSSSDSESEDEEEHIVVTRPEDERDPEADAEFDRELAKMMAESLDSRKFERKPMFDVPLPMKRSRDAPASNDENNEQQQEPAPPTMKFALLSRRGNKQQVWRFTEHFTMRSIADVLIFQSADQVDRPTRRFDLRCCHAHATRGRARRAAAHQKSCLELRSS